MEAKWKEVKEARRRAEEGEWSKVQRLAVEWQIGDIKKMKTKRSEAKLRQEAELRQEAGIRQEVELRQPEVETM